jgi:putative acetyltransferase
MCWGIPAVPMKFCAADGWYSKCHGFVECPPFANYVLDPNSVFMSLNLQET